MNRQNPVLSCSLRGLGAMLLYLGLAPASAQPPCYYTPQGVSIPGSSLVFSPQCINNNNMIAGVASGGGDTTRAYIWTPEGGAQLLPLPPGIISMEANGINDLGQVVGIMNNTASWYGFVWDAVNGYTVINLPPPAGNVYVEDINNLGEVVGSLFHRVPPGPWKWDPFVWQNGQFTFLGDIAGPYTTYLHAINDRGDIVGETDDLAANWHAFILTNRSMVTWLEEPTGFSQTLARAINNSGTVVGYGLIPHPFHKEAIAWTRYGTFVVPPFGVSPDSFFFGVNDSNRTVGGMEGAGSDSGIVWQFGSPTKLTLLTVPQRSVTLGWAINNSGYIITDPPRLLTPHWLRTDLTSDCHVTLVDLALLLTEFGSTADEFPSTDLTGDGTVSLDDLALLLADFGR